MKSFEKPPPVTEIQVVHREDSLLISWTYPASERRRIKGFFIEREEADSGRGFERIASVDGEVLQFLDKGFETKREYLYRVRAHNLRDVLGDDGVSVKVVVADLPPIPGGLSYKVTGHSLEIRWEVLESVKYNIYRSYEKGTYPEAPLNKVPLTEAYFADKIVTERTVYYGVTALRDTAIRDEGFPSEALEVDPRSFVPAPPADLKYVPSEKVVYLMWKESPETWVRGYRVYRKGESEPGFRPVGESVVPAFRDNEPLVMKTFYAVTSLGPEKESVPSESVEVSPLVER